MNLFPLPIFSKRVQYKTSLLIRFTISSPTKLRHFLTLYQNSNAFLDFF